MTFSALAARLMIYFSPEERSIPDSGTYPGRNADVLGAINGALQELFGEGKPWIRKADLGAWLNAPTTITIAVTNGATAATITGWQAWFAGCTIAIDGGTIDNRITNASSTVELKFPHDGPTGTVSATVYQDSLTIPDTVARVLEPVRVQGLRIHPMTNAGAGVTYRSSEDYGFRPTALNAAYIPGRMASRVARPTGYYVDTWMPSATATPLIRMALSTAPQEAMQVEYSATLKAPIGTALNSDVIPVPLDYVDSLLWPIARQRLTGSEFFRNESAKEEIGRAYKEAMSLLDSLKPRTRSGNTIRPTH